MCEIAEVYCSTRRKARRDHQCWECARRIYAKNEYIDATGIFDGNPFRRRLCLTCDELHSFLWSLPETECIDDPLHDYLDACGYINNCPHDESLEHGPYCSITSTVAWLRHLNGRWTLALTKYTKANMEARRRHRDFDFLPI
jgi:hypothetical protein